MRRLCVLVLLAAAFGCGATEIRAPVLDVEGNWSLTATEVASTCPVQGSVFPVGPGLTSIGLVDSAVELVNDGEVRSYERAGNRWVKRREVALDDCAGTIAETWTIHSAAGRRMSATYGVEVDVRECASFGLRSCRIDYAVWGVQP